MTISHCDSLKLIIMFSQKKMNNFLSKTKARIHFFQARLYSSVSMLFVYALITVLKVL